MKCIASFRSVFARFMLLVILPAFLPVESSATIFNIADADVAGLIAAINAANSSAGADTINLAAGGTYTLTVVSHTAPYPGPSGLPRITSPITINGNGATIQRSSAPLTPDFRIFYISGVGGDLVLNELTVKGGRAVQGAPGYMGGGSGIRIDEGKLLLVKCTVTENSGSPILQGTGDNSGGGILNFLGGRLTVINSTISYNTGYGGRTGGGILNLSSPYVSTTTIINSTLFENRADGPAGFQGRGDALSDNYSPPGNIIIKNSILASPTQGSGNDLFCNPGPVPWTSLGHNLVSDASGGLTGPGDMHSTAPMLGPLANNGGPTRTHAPLSGSPVIGAVPLADCTDANGAAITTDQRGVTRPQGAACEIGSFEFCVSGGPVQISSVSPSQGPLCASTFPVHFQGSNLVAGAYTARVQDAFGNVAFDFTPTVSGSSINALFNLTGLLAGSGTVGIQPPGACFFINFPFTINPCPGGSGVQVRLYGAATLRPGRTWQYVVSVINFGPGTSAANDVQVDGLPQNAVILMNPPGSSSPAISPVPSAGQQGFTIGVPALNAGSSADVVFTLTPDFPSVGFTYPLGAHFTSGYVGSDSLPITVVGSMDPNDKTGPSGVGGARYLKGDSMLAYNIVFENDPLMAIAPAQQVVIFDQLDPATVNLNTFLFGPITFGNQLVTPPFRQNPFTVSVPYDVDGNPLTTADNLLVQIDGNLQRDPFSPAYGQITWTFQSIDPSTGLPPADPFVGFLPPDLIPPEGQGSVSFQILPQATLVSDDTIANQASIVFDVNPPITTPVWVNAIDKTPPASQVDVLPAAQSSATFPLTWFGSDAGAGVAGFTLYASEDGGPYSVLQSGTMTTSGYFTGQAGRTYRFYSVATDLVGNVEQAPADADATTAVTAVVHPTQVWIGLKNSDDVGTKFDLLAEVFQNGSLLGFGQLNSVPGGSSGFNNAVLRMIDTALPANVVFQPGDTLSLRLSVRIAVNVNGHSSGTARLWFNDAAAHSQFTVTVAGAATQYYLLNNSVLSSSAGPGPRKTIDVLVNKNAAGNPFKPFGTWSKVF